MRHLLRLLLASFWFLLASRLTSAQRMAITFDDLPSHGSLPPGETRLEVATSILATLHTEHMPQTYGFINGKEVETDPDTEAVLKAWRDAGQPLGNHSWSHPTLEKVTPEYFEADILKNESLLQRWMPTQDWHWFRYPFLHEGETVEKHRAVRTWLAAHGYKIAEVNMDFEDYLWNDPYARCAAKHDDAAIKKLHDSYLATADEYITVFRRLSRIVYGRDVKYILLMHLGAFDARMLPELVALYRARGFTFISLPEAEQDPAYNDDPDIGVRGGGALLEQMMTKLKAKFPANSKPYKELENTCK